MLTTSKRSLSDPQAGAITIIAALMLLALLTAVAFGMSKNALREVAISGTSRQGSMAQNTADSGIEWAVFWLVDANASGATSTSTAIGLRNLKSKLASDSTLAGRSYNPLFDLTGTSYTSTQGLYNPERLLTPDYLPSDLTIASVSGTTQAFTVGLTRMGKLPIANMSQGTGPASFSPAQGNESLQAPDLWALRSDGQITVGSGAFSTRFIHSKEAWISTPVGN